MNVSYTTAEFHFIVYKRGDEDETEEHHHIWAATAKDAAEHFCDRLSEKVYKEFDQLDHTHVIVVHPTTGEITEWYVRGWQSWNFRAESTKQEGVPMSTLRPSPLQAAVAAHKAANPPPVDDSAERARRLKRSNRVAREVWDALKSSGLETFTLDLPESKDPPTTLRVRVLRNHGHMACIQVYFGKDEQPFVALYMCNDGVRSDPYCVTNEPNMTNIPHWLDLMERAIGAPTRAED